MPATEHFFRDQKKMHLIFAISCVVLLVSVVWMMIQDYSDPWYAYQRTNYQLQAAAKERAIAEMKSQDFVEKLEAEEARLAELNQKLKNEYQGLNDAVEQHRDKATRAVESLALRLKNENALLPR